jgi:hypothetical protein
MKVYKYTVYFKGDNILKEYDVTEIFSTNSFPKSRSFAIRYGNKFSLPVNFINDTCMTIEYDGVVIRSLKELSENELNKMRDIYKRKFE